MIIKIILAIILASVAYNRYSAKKKTAKKTAPTTGAPATPPVVPPTTKGPWIPDWVSKDLWVTAEVVAWIIVGIIILWAVGRDWHYPAGWWAKWLLVVITIAYLTLGLTKVIPRLKWAGVIAAAICFAATTGLGMKKANLVVIALAGNQPEALPVVVTPVRDEYEWKTVTYFDGSSNVHQHETKRVAMEQGKKLEFQYKRDGDLCHIRLESKDGGQTWEGRWGSPGAWGLVQLKSNLEQDNLVGRWAEPESSRPEDKQGGKFQIIRVK